MKNKKIIICSVVIIVLAIVCCVIFAFNHLFYRGKIAVNGAVYVQNGKDIATLSDGSREIGMLQGIIHKSFVNPTENFTATNLDEKYAGCMLYQCGENDTTIYLEDYSGRYISFEFTGYISSPENDIQ